MKQTEDGCEADCARAACKEALATLVQAKADADTDAPAGCGSDCVERTEDSLQFWIDYLEVNFDTCVEAASKGLSFNFPAPADVEAVSGALTCGKLTLGCTLDEQTAPYDLEQTCSTSANEPLAATPLILECEIDGEVEIDGPEGYAFTTLEGTVMVRRESPCTSGSCWFSIDSVELDADAFSGSGYIGRSMHASLAYEGFGRVDSSTDEGTIATGMFSLDVTMDGDTPSTSLQSYSFRMANSDSAVFEVSTGQFQVVDAYFAWADHDVVITSDLGNCVCVNCAL